MSYHYTLDTQDIIINEPDVEGRYEVIWSKQHVGYIFVKDIDEDLGLPIWGGSTEYLNQHAPEIGKFIESSDL